MTARIGSLTADAGRFMPRRTVDDDEIAPEGRFVGGYSFLYKALTRAVL